MTTLVSNEQQSVPVQATEVPTEQAASQGTLSQESVNKLQASLQDLLSEDLKAQANIGDFKTADDLAKSYINLQKMMGKSVRIPSEDASPEARVEFLNKIRNIDGVIVKPQSEADQDEFFTKLGRPSTKDQYDFTQAITPEALAADPALATELNSFKELSYELGLTNAQASKLVSLKAAEIAAIDAALKESVEQGTKRLHEIWGQDYDNRLEAAKQVAQIYNEKFGNEMSELVSGPAGNNPALLAMMAELATVYKEKGHEGMQKSHFGITPEEAQSKISEKRSDPGFMRAYTNERDPGHTTAVNEMARLYQLARGGN